MVNKKYDVIVIGSGIGGLVVACRLSFKHKVVVLEKNATFGGYCSTFKRGQFTFESAIHAINSCKEGRFAYDILKDCRVVDKIRVLKPENLYRGIFPDYDVVVPQENEAAYIEKLKKLFPKDKAGIGKIFEQLNFLFLEVDKINSSRSLKRSPNLIKYSKLSLKNMLDECTDNEKLKAIVSQYWMYCGLPPSKLSPIHFSYINQDYLLNGGYCIEGGIQKVINNLIAKIKENGGEVYANNEVSEILAENNNVSGVVTKKGQAYLADCVISNMDACRTFESIHGNHPRIKDYLEQMRVASPSVSASRIYLGLGVNLKKHGVKDYEFFINSSYDLDADYDALLKGKVDDVPFGLCVHSMVDSTLCDTNKSIVSITVLSGYECWKNMDSIEYKAKKLKMADSLIKRAGSVIPGLKDYIETVIVATPLTMERYTGNSKGAAYGWSRNTHFYGSKYMNIQTPVNNLYLTSNWTKIGGGVEGVMRASERTYQLLESKDA